MTVSTGMWKAMGTDLKPAVAERGWSGEILKLKQVARSLADEAKPDQKHNGSHEQNSSQK